MFKKMISLLLAAVMCVSLAAGMPVAAKDDGYREYTCSVTEELPSHRDDPDIVYDFKFEAAKVSTGYYTFTKGTYYEAYGKQKVTFVTLKPGSHVNVTAWGRAGRYDAITVPINGKESFHDRYGVDVQTGKVDNLFLGQYVDYKYNAFISYANIGYVVLCDLDRDIDGITSKFSNFVLLKFGGTVIECDPPADIEPTSGFGEVSFEYPVQLSTAYYYPCIDDIIITFSEARVDKKITLPVLDPLNCDNLQIKEYIPITLKKGCQISVAPNYSQFSPVCLRVIYDSKSKRFEEMGYYYNDFSWPYEDRLNTGNVEDILHWDGKNDYPIMNSTPYNSTPDIIFRMEGDNYLEKISKTLLCGSVRETTKFVKGSTYYRSSDVTKGDITSALSELKKSKTKNVTLQVYTQNSKNKVVLSRNAVSELAKGADKLTVNLINKYSSDVESTFTFSKSDLKKMNLDKPIYIYTTPSKATVKYKDSKGKYQTIKVTPKKVKA